MKGGQGDAERWGEGARGREEREEGVGDGGEECIGEWSERE